MNRTNGFTHKQTYGDMLPIIIKLKTAQKRRCSGWNIALFIHLDFYFRSSCFSSGVMLFAQIAIVDALCKKADVAGGSTLNKPNSNKVELKPRIKR